MKLSPPKELSSLLSKRAGSRPSFAVAGASGLCSFISLLTSLLPYTMPVSDPAPSGLRGILCELQIWVCQSLA